MPATMIAATAAELRDYQRAGRRYSHRTTMALQAELDAPALPMIHYEGDPAELTGTVWARCELVLRDLAATDDHIIELDQLEQQQPSEAS